MTPFFSIIIPVLNEEKYLPKLLRDLSKQTYKDFEVIVVDGKSEDKTVENTEKLRSKLPKLTILTSDKRHVSIQRNMGAKKAQGDWLMFMDADNRLPDYFLDGIRYKIHKHKPDVFTSWCNPDSDEVPDKLISSYISLSTEVGRMMDKPIAWGAFIGISHEAFNAVRGFSTKLAFGEDKKLVQDAFKKGYIFKVFNEPRYIFSVRRFKKSGRIQAIMKYIELSLKEATDGGVTEQDDYPMGGHVFEEKRNTKKKNN